MNLNSLHISRTVAVVIVLVIIVLAAIGYTLMQGDTDDAVITTDDAASASEATFITLASELDSISFDTRVLSDPRFLGLANIHTAITPEPQGREDPFGSLGR